MDADIVFGTATQKFGDGGVGNVIESKDNRRTS